MGLRPRQWVLLIAGIVWTLQGMLQSASELAMRDPAVELTYGEMGALWTRNMIGAWLWIPVTWLCVEAVRWFLSHPRGLAATLLAHAGLVGAVVLFRAVAVVLLNPLVHWYPAPPAFADVLYTSFINNFIAAVLITGVAYAVVLQDLAQARQRRAAELSERLLAARLQALTAQMNPHFLFNALNSLSELLHQDPRKADRMIAALGDLLRMGLEEPATQLQTLEREVQLAERYLALEELRLGEALVVRWALDDRLGAARVPRFMLQPLVENAIRHGRSPASPTLEVQIRTTREGDTLVIEVSDNGTGTGREGAHAGNGISLNNIRERLAALFEDACDFRLVRNEGRPGHTARLRLPLDFQRGMP